MKTVWKYNVAPDDTFELEMPADAQVLSVQVQGGFAPCLWALVDPDAATEIRRFHVVGTGHPIDPNERPLGRFIDTFQVMDGGLVFHVFEAAA